MNVFLSWSGPMSQQIAVALRDWLPKVIQAARPFISGDIDKGDRWGEKVATELDKTGYAIICITPFNLRAPWLNFEAGAVSKALRGSFVSPFLFGIERSKIQGPLQQFQLTVYEKEDVFKLLCSINKQLEVEQQLSYDLLLTEFERWWPDLEDAMDKVSEQEVETETGFCWLNTKEDFVRRQEQIDCRQIWVITSSLHACAAEARKTIQQNIARDITYTFITQSPAQRDAKDFLNKLFAAKPKQLIIKEIAQGEFHRLAATDYVILNPEDDGTHQLHVFLELPIEPRGFWIEVDNEAAADFVARFRRLAKDK